MNVSITMDSHRIEPDGADTYMGFLAIGAFRCYVLQRLPPGTRVSTGERGLVWVKSSRLGKWTLRIKGTPFLVHAGNKPADSLGCFLPGLGAATFEVTQSRTAVAEIERILGVTQGVDAEVGILSYTR